MYLFALSALALAPLLPARAAVPPIQDPWEPWYGCWRAEGAPAGEAVCILPDGPGVRMLTIEQGEVRAESHVYADGVARRSERDGCTMLESARWSRDRQRVFLASELSCQGQVARSARGLIAFTGPGRWLNVQTIAGEDGGTAVRAVRFSPADNVSLPASLPGGVPGLVRTLALDPLDEGDVVEATEQLDPESVQEWLRAADAPFQLADDAGSPVYGSALDELAGMSRSVEHRTVTVVHVLEPRSCIYNYCSWLRTYSCWSPWGYDRFAWRIPRIAYWRRPALIHIGINIGIGRGIRIARYDDYWYRRHDWWRYDSRDRWRGFGEVTRSYGVGRGYATPAVTRTGHSSGRDLSQPGTGRTVTARGDLPNTGTARRNDMQRTATPRGTGIGVVRTDAPRPDRASGTTARGTLPRTGTTRSAPIVRTESPRTATPRGTAIGRGDPPRMSPPRSSGVSRSEPRTATPRGTAIGRGDPPRSSAPAARSSPPRSSPPRASTPRASGRGDPPARSSGSRGTARPRQ